MSRGKGSTGQRVDGMTTDGEDRLTGPGRRQLMNRTVMYIAFSFAALPFADANADTDDIAGPISCAGSLNG